MGVAFSYGKYISLKPAIPALREVCEGNHCGTVTWSKPGASLAKTASVSSQICFCAFFPSSDRTNGEGLWNAVSLMRSRSMVDGGEILPRYSLLAQIGSLMISVKGDGVSQSVGPHLGGPCEHSQHGSEPRSWIRAVK